MARAEPSRKLLYAAEVETATKIGHRTTKALSPARANLPRFVASAMLAAFSRTATPRPRVQKKERMRSSQESVRCTVRTLTCSEQWGG